MNATSENIKRRNAREVPLTRNPKILKRQVDDTVFLVNPEDDTIFYLNPLSAGIWNLLAEPTTPSEAERIVKQAFPDVSPDQIAADVSKLIAELEKKGLTFRLP
jgi:Coenzyme PQQ synthesis protein D (PqqD)